MSYQGNDPATGNPITYQDGASNDVWDAILSNSNNSGVAILFKIWEYGSPSKVNFYSGEPSVVTSGTGQGLYMKSVFYIGGTGESSFGKPIIGWGQNGTRGATSGERLLFSGTRSYSGFTPVYSGGGNEYDFGIQMGTLGSPVNGQPVSTQFKTSPLSSGAIMKTTTGAITIDTMSAGFRVNSTFGVGDKLIIRGVAFFNKTFIGTTTGQAELRTTVSYLNLGGTWDPSQLTQNLIPFAGSNVEQVNVVSTGVNGSTCIFEHIITCDDSVAMVAGDVLYFGWSVNSLSGEAPTGQPSSCTFQIYRD
tara:strand:- start:347 stop:1264 length:918 start_codon:yes stop_codon:yes gene_type:complete